MKVFRSLYARPRVLHAHVIPEMVFHSIPDGLDIGTLRSTRFIADPAVPERKIRRKYATVMFDEAS